MIKKLYSKITEVTITSSTMEYGSLTLDEDLMDLARIKEYDAVDVNGATTLSRITTYVLKAPRGSKTVGVRGGASQHFKKGDKVHILKYYYTENEDSHCPLIVNMNEA